MSGGGILYGEDWLMRPIMRGMCRYENLYDTSGVMTLFDWAVMNEALEVEDENTRRAQDAARPGR